MNSYMASLDLFALRCLLIKKLLLRGALAFVETGWKREKVAGPKCTPGEIQPRRLGTSLNMW